MTPIFKELLLWRKADNMVSDKSVADFTTGFHNLCSYNTMQPDLPKAKFWERLPGEKSGIFKCYNWDFFISVLPSIKCFYNDTEVIKSITCTEVSLKTNLFQNFE